MKGGRIAFPQEYYGKDTGNYTVENGNNYSSRAQLQGCANFIGPDLQFGQSGGKGRKGRRSVGKGRGNKISGNNNNNNRAGTKARNNRSKKTKRGSQKVRRSRSKRATKNNRNNAVSGMKSSCGYRRK